MARLLLILAIAGVAYYLYRRLTAGQQGGNREDATPPAAAPAMARCAECGVHAPEADGVRYQTLFFCSPEHLETYVRKRGPDAS